MKSLSRILVFAFVCAASVACGQSQQPNFGRVSDETARFDKPPRKVIVGTMIAAWRGSDYSLPQRVKEMSDLVDQVARQSQDKYGRWPDIIVFPEYALTMGRSGSAQEIAVAAEGLVQEAFAQQARKYQTYIVLGGIFSSPDAAGTCKNEAVVLDRKGTLVGRYAKAHPVAYPTVEDGQDSLEGGIIPGDRYNIIECDFGRVGIQICYDAEFPEGWQKLAERHADLVLYPTASPQLTRPASYAAFGNYWVVSATPRSNASFFEPGTGSVAAQITGNRGVLAHEIDLSYLVLPWSPMLGNGRTLTKKFEDRVGYHYSETEDRGVFWSNDPNLSIGEMARQTNLLRTTDKRERSQRLHDATRPGPIR